MGGGEGNNMGTVKLLSSGRWEREKRLFFESLISGRFNN